MSGDFIKIRGARIHNLKNVNIDIPRNKLIVITGISGSGKSSLVFDTLYAEGQRRYVESLSVYARQFLGIMKKPDVDKIEGISPAISIDQRKAAHNPRSTVGTITEIYDYLRLLFARIGTPYCPECGKPVSRQTIDQIVKQVLSLPEDSEVLILGPVIRGKKGEHRRILEEIERSGFIRVRVDNVLHRIEQALELKLAKYKKHNIEVVVDRLKISKDLPSATVQENGLDKEDTQKVVLGLDRARLVDSLETALKLGKGVTIVSVKKSLSHRVIESSRKKLNHSVTELFNDLIFSEHFACEKCGISLPELEPRLFSFNSPFGACRACQGLGEKLEVDPKQVLPNPNLSIAEGAVFPWTRVSHRVGRQGFFWRRLEELSEKYNFSLYEPVKDLSKPVINAILYGGDSFEGVIPWLERRYHETNSDYARKEIKKYMIERQCKVCRGRRLRPEALAIKVAGDSIDQLVEMFIFKLQEFFKKLEKKGRLSENELKIGKLIIKEISKRAQFLIDVGLGYLTLDRKSSTLSGGEESRVRLATQIGSRLSGVLYILDEPSVGLHPRDQKMLIETLKKLRDLKNTVLVVEHDPQTIMAADWVIDLGPGAGRHGGRVIFEGIPKDLLRSKTLTGQYLSGRKKVEFKEMDLGLEPGDKKEALSLKPQASNLKHQTLKFLVIKGAKEHNLKDINVKIPLGKFVCITGVSGSGKSSLLNDILARALLKKFYGAKKEPGEHTLILGQEFLDKVVLVDQSPIGRTSRSNPATYTGTFTFIRDIFSKTRESRIRGYRPGRFSFNVKGGRCEACRGEGMKKIEMYFLPDIYVQCQECKGKRYNKETLQIEYKGKNIAEILEATLKEGLNFFKNIPSIFQRFGVLNEVGLGYIQLGQPAPSLSGGEAQRVKLANELSKKATGKTLYILDEPTTGLHPHDIKKLLFVLKKLVNRGNTVLIIEHNSDIIKNADWILDLGPEGGERGGYIVAQGTPQDIAKNKKSCTGRYLKRVLK